MSIKEILSKKLSKKDLSKIHTGFDIIGSIAIIDVPKGLEKKVKIIGSAIMKQHPNIKTVLKKTSKRKGVHRTYDIKFVCGKRTRETVHRESGCLFKVDVVKCYFSPRLASERLRASALVRPGERVLVMFSGVAPYNIVIAKHSKAKEVVGVEINRLAHKYAVENVALNRVGDRVKVLNGDCKKVVPNLGLFDRVFMCLPKSNEDFFEEAFSAVKNGGMIHFYTFVREDELERAADKVKVFCKHKKLRCLIKNISKAGAYAPRVVRVRVDVLVRK